MTRPNPSLMKKSAARMAAVQCLYQHEYATELNADQLIVARLGIEAEEEGMLEELEPLDIAPDAKLLRGIVTGAIEQKVEIDRKLAEILGTRWSGHRMPDVMRALFRCAAYELLYHPQLKTGILLDQYVTLATSFFDDQEVGFVNGALQEAAKALREASIPS
ncbi:MAG: transcription antitermination factor NusB [Rickettsiales bacterium]|nr:transcription antitermination factor NusB [Rickettsiales bacterium]